MTAWLLIALIAAGDLYTETFDNANAAYLAGDYTLSARKYEDLVAEGTRDSAVFYNLGNAYYRQGALGLAIANYERALRINPSHEQAKDNLARAVAATKTKTVWPQPPAWEQNLLFWHFSLGQTSAWWLAACAWAGFWLLLGVHIWRRVPYGVAGLTVLLVLACALGWSAWRKAHPEPAAVAVAVASETGVPLRYGPGDAEDIVSFGGSDDGEALLYDGDRVRVETRTAGWARVHTADGRRGWVSEKSLAFVTPPFSRPELTDMQGEEVLTEEGDDA